jgi:hypothetical protein
MLVKSPESTAIRISPKSWLSLAHYAILKNSSHAQFEARIHRKSSPRPWYCLDNHPGMANIPSFGRIQSGENQNFLLLRSCCGTLLSPMSGRAQSIGYPFLGLAILKSQKTYRANVVVGCETTTTFFTNSV